MALLYFHTDVFPDLLSLNSVILLSMWVGVKGSTERRFSQSLLSPQQTCGAGVRLTLWWRLTDGRHTELQIQTQVWGGGWDLSDSEMHKGFHLTATLSPSEPGHWLIKRCCYGPGGQKIPNQEMVLKGKYWKRLLGLREWTPCCPCELPWRSCSIVPMWRCIWTFRANYGDQLLSCGSELRPGSALTNNHTYLWLLTTRCDTEEENNNQNMEIRSVFCLTISHFKRLPRLALVFTYRTRLSKSRLISTTLKIYQSSQSRFFFYLCAA